MKRKKFEAENQLGQYRRRFRIAFRYQYNISETQEDIYSFTHQHCGDWHVHSGDALRIPEHPATHSDNIRPLIPGYPATL